MIVTANSDYCPCSITNWYFEMEKENVYCEAGADIVNCLIMWGCGV
jgi:isoleucyl-tRNA synthetase